MAGQGAEAVYLFLTDAKYAPIRAPERVSFQPPQLTCLSLLSAAEQRGAERRGARRGGHWGGGGAVWPLSAPAVTAPQADKERWR